MALGFSYVQFLSLLISCLAISSECAMASPVAVKAAYWPSSTTSFPPSAINTSFFTHVYYAFLMPNNATFQLEITSNRTAAVLSNFTNSLRHKNPPVKTLLSIGGGGSDSLLFARMASEAESRKIFIDSTIDVARGFGFDGLDLDWEFPQGPKEMENLGLLLKEWRLAIEKETTATGRAPLLLTAAVYYSVDITLLGAHRSYPVRSINQYTDWISPMCFDYHGSWDTSETGAHAALYDPKGNLSTSYGLQSWIRAGVLPEKLVMGLPLYGKTWKLKEPIRSHGIGSPAIDVGPGEGILTFSQVEEFNEKNNATIVYDKDTVSAYSFAGSTWIGYDDPKSTTAKIAFAQALGLRGYFFWALSFDNNWKISAQASEAWNVDA